MYPILDTRVECKAYKGTCISCAGVIRIEPDWNVKILTCIIQQATKVIRIEPDWNVKNGERKKRHNG